MSPRWPACASSNLPVRRRGNGWCRGPREADRGRIPPVVRSSGPRGWVRGARKGKAQEGGTLVGRPPAFLAPPPRPAMGPRWLRVHRKPTADSGRPTERDARRGWGLHAGASVGLDQAIVTGVPSGVMFANLVITSFGRRTQPFDTFLPMLEGSFVPWMPSWPSPPANSVRASEWPDSPKANGP